jgi:ABC-type lipoprotein release transport system permease subunit
MSRVSLLVWMGIRNLFLHRIRSLVVGTLLVFASFLVVFGAALVSSVKVTMEKSITSSLAGEIQLYDAQAKDKLALFPSGAPSSMDYGEIPDFRALRETVMAVPGVKEVVPMGLTNALVFGGTEVDRVLERLRAAVRTDVVLVSEDAPPTGNSTSVTLLSEQVRQIALGLESDVHNTLVASADPSVQQAQLDDLEKVRSKDFWDGLSGNPEQTLLFLESHIAPLASDGRTLYMRLIGTDLVRFGRAFDRFHVVDGTMVPEGRRGLLLSKRFYETQVKNEVAHGLDEIRDGRVQGRSIQSDTLLQERVRRNIREYRRVLFEIAPDQVEGLASELRTTMPGSSGDLSTLFQAFLDTSDADFDSRYAFFYDHVAPRIRLYDVPVGDTVTLRGFTKTGYARASNVKLYGTFQFSGLETSDLAGANQLVDLITFRDLYGRMSPEQQAELAGIRKSAGVEDLSRENAESELFGGGGGLETAASTASGPTVDASRAALTETTRSAQSIRSDVATTGDDHRYTEAEMDDGLVLDAAVILDPELPVHRALPAIRAALAQDGLDIQAVDWKQAAGLIGQLITVIQAVIYTGIVIIFLVALAVINNTMMMSAMERTQEIGTMRAIGSPRSFVVGMLVLETSLLGLAAGGLGTLLGAALVALLGRIGIPATADILVLLFAGPRLYPVFSAGNLVFGLTVVVAFAVLSALQPTLLAARVSPVVAMAQKD